MGSDVDRAVQIAVCFIAAALLVRGSLLAPFLAGAAAAPGGYVMWMGAQDEGSRTYVVGLSLFLGSLLLALILFLLWLF